MELKCTRCGKTVVVLAEDEIAELEELELYLAAKNMELLCFACEYILEVQFKRALRIAIEIIRSGQQPPTTNRGVYSRRNPGTPPDGDKWGVK